MDENFLLTTDTAKSLYHGYAEKQPIIDYHCHINPKEIYEDKKFENITEIWLGGDHYKWRLMRANGIEEKYITGDASPRDKFQKWAETLSIAIGNPLYHWSHLELKRYFGYQGILNVNTAEEVWNIANELLSKPSMSARNIIKASNVTTICTTDSPTDSLEWHKKLASDETFTVKVLPTFRPEKAINIEQPDFVQHVSQLSELSGIAINSFASFCNALSNRIDYFVSVGCRISDHSLPYVMYVSASGDEIEAIYQKRIDGIIPNENEQLAYKTALMLFLGREYHKRDWAMQLHYGTLRDNNTLMHQQIGPDTGFDCINNNSSSAQLSAYLNELNLTNQLPKTIVYSLNPADNSYIDTVIGCFQDSSAVGKLQHGSAWWFNDHKAGMLEQLTSLSNSGLLANFIGMLTDSRSFLSYTRHEYFRRILCNLFGNLVEAGEYPDDMNNLGSIVKNISYNNAINYFKVI